jgi:hypothetical protein
MRGRVVELAVDFTKVSCAETESVSDEEATMRAIVRRKCR